MHFVKCNKKKRNINHNVTNRILRNRHLLCGDIEYIYIYICVNFSIDIRIIKILPYNYV